MKRILPGRQWALIRYRVWMLNVRFPSRMRGQKPSLRERERARRRGGECPTGWGPRRS